LAASAEVDADVVDGVAAATLTRSGAGAGAGAGAAATLACGAGAAAGRGAAAAFGAGVAARTRIQYIVRSVSFCAFSAAAEAAADGATTWAIVAVLEAAPASIRTQRAMILKSGMAVVLR
jgi:hypothetical protein